MFQAHSLLWHYLWVAPNLLLLILAFLTWRRRLIRQVPVFFAFAILSAVTELTEYATDVIPTVSAATYWRADWASLLIQGALKFALVGEIFAHVFGSYESIARLGRLLIRTLGVGLVLAAAIAAAYTPQNGHFGIISGARLLDQAIFTVESGLLVFIFVFSLYFHLVWDRPLFGITLGLSISSCVHLASWAILDNLGLPDSKRIIFVFLNMATYHAVVFIWYYYLLVPGKTTHNAPQSQGSPPLGLSDDLPEHELEAWNEELERLIHK
jgi:hypothetical protein